MKRTLLPLALLTGAFQVNAQITTNEAGFENLTISTDSFINGSNGDTLFNEAGFDFPVHWHEAWSFWEGGFAASNQTDSTRTGTDGLFQSITGGGHQSANYLIGQNGSILGIDTENGKFLLDRVYITNNSYAYFSMLDGDQVGKKFGGANGTDPDYFRLIIHGKKGMNTLADSVIVYLADFRSNVPSEDYILGTWEEVDLSIFGDADSLVFSFQSSDTGAFGINTPTFFVMDDISHIHDATGLASVEKSHLNLYPNPAQNSLQITGPERNWRIVDIRGELMMEGFGMLADLSTLKPGMYILQNESGLVSRFIKQQ